MSLTVIVPSRGRPEKARELASAFRRTATDPGTRLVIVYDHDDPTWTEYPLDVSRASPTSGSMVTALNWAANVIASVQNPPFAIAFLGDDHRPRTPGWDVAYLNALREMSTGVVYGDDLIQGEKMPTQVALTSDIPRTLGYFAPPTFTHLCVDLCWKEWGLGIDRLKYLPEVVIEHMHPCREKSAWDVHYERVNAPEIVAKDSAEFYRWKEQDLPGEIVKLKELLK